MEKLLGLGLLVAGVIHLLPIVGVLGGERLTALYGIQITDPNLLILMRHRAILFAVLGGLLVLAIFQVQLQWPAILFGLVSALSFIVIVYQTSAYNEAISRVLMADYVAVAALLLAALVKLKLQIT